MCRDMRAGHFPSTTCDRHFPPHPESGASVNTEACDVALRHTHWQDVRTSPVGWIYGPYGGKGMLLSSLMQGVDAQAIRASSVRMWPADHAHYLRERHLSHRWEAWRRGHDGGELSTPPAQVLSLVWSKMESLAFEPVPNFRQGMWAWQTAVMRKYSVPKINAAVYKRTTGKA